MPDILTTEHFFCPIGYTTVEGWWTSGSDADSEGNFIWDITGDPILTRAEGMGWGR